MEVFTALYLLAKNNIIKGSWKHYFFLKTPLWREGSF